ncbi:nodulin MtN21 /EamA-like transporter family protein [Prunus dulcis]|uniref:WAT1-related protein n=1 Tax=Prunus dulcis TaxID=3755 RepID=A0A4Y1R2Z1_PRUDU|nr:nodulin MtN21 /EamA-like transporter family protein [Prunus dulcis]
MELVLAMVMVQIFVTGLQLLSKVILREGTFIFALMAYRHIVAAICVAPFAFFFESSVKQIKLGWSVWFWLFVNALTGITSAMGLFYYGLRDTTPTYATNFLNLIPIATFVLSIITSIDKLNLQTRAGKVKTFGVIVCVGGPSLLAFTRERHFICASTAITLISLSTQLMLTGHVALSCWPAKLLKIFPLKYWATMLTCIMATLQSTVIGLFFDRRAASWRINYVQAAERIDCNCCIGSASHSCNVLLNSWAISVQGPLYPPMFNPLSLIFVALSSAVILGEEIRIGTLLGMILIMFGLYSFLWGQRKEMKSPDLPKSEAPGVAKTNVSCPQPQGCNCHPVLIALLMLKMVVRKAISQKKFTSQ